MRLNRIGLWASSCLFLVTFAACENPGNVGEGLVGGLDGTPETKVLQASSVEPDTVRDVTGNVLVPTIGGGARWLGNSTRVLAGRVADPMLGTMAAKGYVDFAGSTSQAFRNGTVTAAELHLVPNYTYGSVVTQATFRLNEIREEIDMTSAKADTSFAENVIGDFITEFSIKPSDTLVVIPLPPAFIAANDTTFRSERFATSFHGFQISSTGTDAIRGFSADSSMLRVVSGQDTVDFPVTKILTTLTRESEPTLPEGYVLIQDGFGEAANFDFPFEQAGFGPSAINRVVFALPADTVATQANAPAGFVRPLLREVSLYTLSDDGDVARLGYTSLIDFRLGTKDARFILDHEGLTDIVQSRLEGDDTLSGFRITPDVESNTINPILIYTGNSQTIPDPGKAPQATVTFTPTE